MDFKADWHDMLKEIMGAKWGLDTKGITEDVPVHYFNAAQRRIPVKPRALLVSDVFHCPPEHLLGWTQIKKKVEQGQDLSPHLSKLIDEIGKTDLMLSDWGVYHLHLGTELKGRYIARTGPLLFARVTEDDFYAISIYSHDDWTDADIVETIHRNWPESIAHWVLKGMQPAEKLTSDQRKTLRKKRYNSFVQVSDGTTYAPIGGGYVFSGHSIFAITEMDKEHDFLECLERLIPGLMPKLLPELHKRGYLEGADIRVSLVLTDLAYFAHFTEYNIAIELQKRRPGPWRTAISRNAKDLK
ncbi:hypothetical protein [Pseudomonas sp. FP2300]|uniref:hypothetical protein n=1 Tax=Pseudomonas sp. FP2300 TaxID=2954090 RepID=UPI0027327C92|nr:hypothetical protein [Pseudomonas sp. FP2300]WLH62065.1 hypothetical protein PSH86_25675 [Pseudomonas sp. FP2300]